MSPVTFTLHCVPHVAALSVEDQRGFASDRGRVFGFSELAGRKRDSLTRLGARQFRKTEHPTPRTLKLTGRSIAVGSGAEGGQHKDAHVFREKSDGPVRQTQVR